MNQKGFFVNEVLPFVAVWEGLKKEIYYDNEKDLTTATVYGIRFSYNVAWLASIGIFRPEDMGMITREQRDRYYFDKWVKSHCPDIVVHFPRLSKNYYDAMFNGGEDDAIQFLQETINRCLGKSILVDGGWGRETQGAFLELVSSRWEDNALAGSFIRSRNECIEKRWAKKNRDVFMSITKRIF